MVQDGTKMFSDGHRLYVIYPDIYYRFVLKLHKEHKDILDAMQLAQVKFEDGSALDFLNLLLGTQVRKDEPMELGFATLYDALERRIVNKHAENAAKKVAAAFKDHTLVSQREDPSQPLFPEEPSQ